MEESNFNNALTHGTIGMLSRGTTRMLPGVYIMLTRGTTGMLSCGNIMLPCGNIPMVPHVNIK